MRQKIDRMLDQALGANPRLAMAAARKLRAECEWIEARAVALARREGYDWGRIGRLLGMSRQAARQRFARQVPRIAPSASIVDDFQRQRDEITRFGNRMAEERCQAQLGDRDVIAW
jgi:hypothetical protein